ncbi:hypothetical protein P6U16_19095 [Rhizobium sp. 32-5/1]|uniref:hypothetical protein n=1 Tax=Rhizobium sp. 32-5/1 TaxID=3019602 RepID=UPI00240E3E9D|nr:hypothetical protein [Rhizobium sp. 32-5/1]WEZ83009.1 hypothetical protein P6U16_19095 [Rhizobium sp. 32-5/1]
MKQNKLFAWFLIVVGGLYLVTGIVSNDMGGLTSLGYNPDMPMTIQDAPIRFLLGVGLYACAVYAGIQMLRTPPPNTPG